MDLVTQTILGASVGETVLGKKAGNKAIVWGALGGIIPDLDIFVTPFFSDVDGLFVHRGFSHSLIFPFLLAPLLGWLAYRIHQKESFISIKDWTILFFLSIFTHPLLDYFTTYGTGAFLPFSDYRVEFGTIGIVDIFYSVPIIITLLIIPFLKRTSLLRKWMMLGTIILTTLYLLGTTINKLHVNSVFKEAYTKQAINYERVRTTCLPLTNFLWMGIAEVESGYHIGLYSNFDTQRPVDFRYIPRNAHKLENISDNEDVKNLIRFTKGFYHVNEDENGLYLSDLRFGMMGVDENADFLFKFYIEEVNGNIIIQKSDKPRKIEADAFMAFIERLKGINQNTTLFQSTLNN